MCVEQQNYLNYNLNEKNLKYYIRTIFLYSHVRKSATAISYIHVRIESRTLLRLCFVYFSFLTGARRDDIASSVEQRHRHDTHLYRNLFLFFFIKYILFYCFQIILQSIYIFFLILNTQYFR